MITQKTLKSYEFNSIDDYYSYIVESLINGQRTQCGELFNNLSKEQKLGFWLYINETVSDKETIADLHKVTA